MQSNSPFRRAGYLANIGRKDTQKHQHQHAATHPAAMQARCLGVCYTNRTAQHLARYRGYSMGVKLSELPGLQKAMAEHSSKEQHGLMWIARTSQLSIKPIVSRDPEVFVKCVERLQAACPGLNIYLFEVSGV